MLVVRRGSSDRVRAAGIAWTDRFCPARPRGLSGKEKAAEAAFSMRPARRGAG